MVDNNTFLSPLDQIRLAESDVTRQITSARVSADQEIARARLQAEQSKKEALEAGRREGKALAKEIVARAEEEANSVTAQGRAQSAELRRRGRQRMKTAVRLAVEIVIGLKEQDTNL